MLRMKRELLCKELKPETSTEKVICHCHVKLLPTGTVRPRFLKVCWA